MKTPCRKILHPALVLLLLQVPLGAAIVGEWNADNYVTGSPWAGTTTATVLAGTPASGSAVYSAGNLIHFVHLDGASVLQSPTDPVAGLAEFSASVVFRTTSNGANGENNFWQNQGLVGIELGGAGVGDWGLGIATGGLINGGSGLAAADTGTIGPAVNNNSWHVATFVADDLGGNVFTQRLYLDGTEVASDPSLTYGGAQTTVATSVLNFGRHAGGAPFFSGDIAHIRLDDVALTPAEISDAHANLLGTLLSTEDTDMDDMPDFWENMFVGLNFNDPSDRDTSLDTDLLSNVEEYENHTDPTNPDTDDDGLNDDVEVNTTLTNPLIADTDGDGLSDGAEINTHLTDPFEIDSDHDGSYDGEEVTADTLPNDDTSYPETLVARWHSDDVAPGPVATWTDRVAGLMATALGAPGPSKDAQGLSFDGLDDAFEVAVAANPLGGRVRYTLTAVFDVTQGTSRQNPNDPGAFFAHSMLVGRELPGADRGDYGLAITSENELLAGWGNPDGGTFHDGVALNDGNTHVASATFAVGTGIALYLDGALVNSTTNNGRSMEQETMYFGVNILNVANDTAYFNGHIRQILLHEVALPASRVERLHSDVFLPDGPPFRITSFQYDPEGGANNNGMFSLTWNSRPSLNYGVYLSPDMSTWDADVNDSIPSQGASTTFTFDHPSPGATLLHFRVQEQ